VSLRPTATPDLDAGERTSGFILRALDLTGEPQLRHVWQPDGRTGALGGATFDLPPDGFASPMGYWFHHTERSADVGGARLIVRDRAELKAAPNGQRRQHRGARPSQTVSLEAPNRVDGRLQLTIGPRVAEVYTSASAWAALAEPVLLVVAQYFRFCAIEQAAAHLSAETRQDQIHVATAGFGTWRQRRRLIDNACAIHGLVSDWIHFAGLYTDPAQYCSSDVSLESYTTLTDELAFEGWSERLDDIVEDLEAATEAITDKLFHYRLFAWGVGLEALIIALIAIGILAR
jgi:hypothetical protein